MFLASQALLATVACSRTEKTEARPAPPPVVPRAAPVTLTRHPGGPRIVAVGDLHGDLGATRAALRLAGAVDESDRWNGGQLVVVQTGDQLDRGDDERAIVDLFERLSEEARAAGGAVIALNGNHETMNIQGDFRYVTPDGFQTFEGVSPVSPLAANFPAAERQRAAAFLPGGAYALKLSKRDVIAVVADNVFAHAGVLSQHVDYGVDRINREVRDWMAKTSSGAPAVVMGEDAPVWTRLYGTPSPNAAVCNELERVLTKLEARRLVVGHTVQQGGIRSGCDGKLQRIDVGMSQHYGKNPIQVLEITGGTVRTLSGTREALFGNPAPLKKPDRSLSP